MDWNWSLWITLLVIGNLIVLNHGQLQQPQAQFAQQPQAQFPQGTQGQFAQQPQTQFNQQPQGQVVQPAQGQFPQQLQGQPPSQQFPQQQQGQQPPQQFPQQVQGQQPPQQFPQQLQGQQPPQQFSQQLQGQQPLQQLQGQQAPQQFPQQRGPQSPPFVPQQPSLNLTDSQKIPQSRLHFNSQQVAPTGAGLSRFQTWLMASRMLLTVPRKADYVLMIAPELVRGIPSLNISQALQLSTPTAIPNPVLKTFIEQSSGMLISQLSIIFQRIRTKLAEPFVIRSIMGSKHPGTMLSLYNPRIVNSSMGDIVKVIKDSSRDRSIAVKTKLLPYNFLSTWISWVRKAGNVPQWTGDDLFGNSFFGNSYQLNLAILGLSCEDLELLKIQDIIPVIVSYRQEFYNLRKEGPLEFPLDLRNCALERIVEFLKTKNATSGEENILTQLTIQDIHAIGGEVLTAIPTAALESLPLSLRLEIIEEIGRVEILDLARLTSVDQLQWYSDIIVRDFIAAAQMGTIPQFGNLFCYGIHNSTNLRNILDSASSSMKTCCLTPDTQQKWANMLKETFGSNTSTWRSTDLENIGDLLISLNPEDIKQLSIEEVARGLGSLTRNSGLNIPIRKAGELQPNSFAKSCVESIGSGAEYMKSYKALMRKFVEATEITISSVNTMNQLLEEDQRTRRKRAAPSYRAYRIPQRVKRETFSQTVGKMSPVMMQPAPNTQSTTPPMPTRVISAQVPQPILSQQQMMLSGPVLSPMSSPSNSQQPNPPMATGRLPPPVATQIMRQQSINPSQSEVQQSQGTPQAPSFMQMSSSPFQQQQIQGNPQVPSFRPMSSSPLQQPQSQGIPQAPSFMPTSTSSLQQQPPQPSPARFTGRAISSTTPQSQNVNSGQPAPTQQSFQAPAMVQGIPQPQQTFQAPTPSFQQGIPQPQQTFQAPTPSFQQGIPQQQQIQPQMSSQQGNTQQSFQSPTPFIQHGILQQVQNPNAGFQQGRPTQQFPQHPNIQQRQQFSSPMQPQVSNQFSQFQPTSQHGIPTPIGPNEFQMQPPFRQFPEFQQPPQMQPSQPFNALNQGQPIVGVQPVQFPVPDHVSTENRTQDKHDKTLFQGRAVNDTEEASANATGTDERPRSLSGAETTPLQLSCPIIEKSGPAAIGLTIEDFNTIPPQELFNCVEAIGFIDWDESMKKELLQLYQEKFKLTEPLTTIHLIAFGSLITALELEDNAVSDPGTTQDSSSSGMLGMDMGTRSAEVTGQGMFGVNQIDLKAPGSLDTIGLLGTFVKDHRTLKLIANHFASVNNLTPQNVRNSNPDESRILVSSLGNIFCRLDNSIVRGLFDSDRNLFLDTSPVLGQLEGCDREWLELMGTYAMDPNSYGNPESWTKEDLSGIGVVVVGLPIGSLARIQPSAMPGLSPLAVREMSTASLQAFSIEQLSNFSYEAAASIQPNQVEVLSPEQISALNQVLTVDSSNFNIEPVSSVILDQGRAGTSNADQELHTRGLDNTTSHEEKPTGRAGAAIDDEDEANVETVLVEEFDTTKDNTTSKKGNITLAHDDLETRSVNDTKEAHKPHSIEPPSSTDSHSEKETSSSCNLVTRNPVTLISIAISLFFYLYYLV